MLSRTVTSTDSILTDERILVVTLALQPYLRMLKINEADDTSLTLEQIKAAYRARVLQVHPDKNPQENGEMFETVRRAFLILERVLKGEAIEEVVSSCDSTAFQEDLRALNVRIDQLKEGMAVLDAIDRRQWATLANGNAQLRSMDVRLGSMDVRLGSMDVRLASQQAMLDENDAALDKISATLDILEANKADQALLAYANTLRDSLDAPLSHSIESLRERFQASRNMNLRLYSNRMGEAYSCTPLMLAAIAGDIVLVRYLIERQATLDLATEYGWSANETALGLAIQKLNALMVYTHAPLIQRTGIENDLPFKQDLLDVMECLVTQGATVTESHRHILLTIQSQSTEPAVTGHPLWTLLKPQSFSGLTRRSSSSDFSSSEGKEPAEDPEARHRVTEALVYSPSSDEEQPIYPSSTMPTYGANADASASSAQVVGEIIPSICCHQHQALLSSAAILTRFKATDAPDALSQDSDMQTDLRAIADLIPTPRLLHEGHLRAIKAAVQLPRNPTAISTLEAAAEIRMDHSLSPTTKRCTNVSMGIGALLFIGGVASLGTLELVIALPVLSIGAAVSLPAAGFRFYRWMYPDPLAAAELKLVEHLRHGRG